MSSILFLTEDLSWVMLQYLYIYCEDLLMILCGLFHLIVISYPSAHASQTNNIRADTKKVFETLSS